MAKKPKPKKQKRKPRTLQQKTKKRIQNYQHNIRQAFKFSETYQQVFDNALSQQKGPRGGSLYTCYLCSQPFKKTDLEVEHKTTVIPFELYYYQVSEKDYYNRVFCDISNLDVACRVCHASKSNNERKLRTQAKAAKATKATEACSD